MIEEIAWLLLGIFAGIISGLVPGLHANTIAAMLVYLPVDKSLGAAMFIVSMSITHSFIDAIPSILLGAASEENSLNLLPGHELLLRGKGLEAIQTTVLGGVATGVFAVALLPFFFSFAKNYGNQLPIVIPAIIFLTICLMMLGEKNKVKAAAIIAASGALGGIALAKGSGEIIAALVIGFFAVPGLLHSIAASTAIPEQEKNSEDKKIGAEKGFVSALTSGMLAVFPGIGPSQAATIVNAISGKMGRHEYLFIGGGINIGNLLFSMLMLFALGKTRTGMAAALRETVLMNWQSFFALLLSGIAAIGIAAIATEIIAAEAVQKIREVNYAGASKATLVFLVAVVAWISGMAGIAACISAAGISLAGLSWKVRRANCMGFLLLPTMLFYLGL